MHAALEVAGRADRASVAAALRAMDITTGAAKFFPGGRVKFDARGRRESATLLIVPVAEACTGDGVPGQGSRRRTALAEALTTIAAARGPLFPLTGSTRTNDDLFDTGLEIRKAVLGKEFVEKSLTSADDFNMPMQRLTTE